MLKLGRPFVSVEGRMEWHTRQGDSKSKGPESEKYAM